MSSAGVQPLLRHSSRPVRADAPVSFLFAFLSLALFGAASCCRAGSAESAGRIAAFPVEVGDFDDGARLSFQGIKTFTDRSIREALTQDPDYLLAAHPKAPFKEYLVALQKMIQAGYQHAGFPNVEVSVRLDEGERITVRVEEGPRYRIADVKVIGAKTIPVEQLVRRLTEPYPPVERRSASGNEQAIVPVDRTGKAIEPQRPLWPQGEPATFDEPALRAITSAVTNALADLGRLFPKVNVRILPIQDAGRADLRVEITDEGPSDVVAEIEVTGNRKNNRAELIEFLRLAPGMTVNREALTRIELALWRSGRFLSHSATVERLPSDPSKLKLMIKLKEFEGAPALTKDFSPIEKVLLKLGDWLANFASGHEDMSVAFSGEFRGILPNALQGRLIFSPKSGALLQLDQARAGGPRDDMPTLLLTANRLAYFRSASSQKLDAPIRQAQFRGFLEHVPNPDEKSKDLFSINVGAGVGSKQWWEPDPESPFKIDTLMAPVAFIGLAHRTNQNYRITNGLLTFSGEEVQFRIDATSGRLMEFRASNAKSNEMMELRFEKGLFEKTLREVEKQSARASNAFDPQRPLTSMARFFVEEWMQSLLLPIRPGVPPSAEQRRRGAQAAQKILDRNILAPFEAALNRPANNAEENFYVPILRPFSEEAATAKMISVAAAWIFKQSAEMFPKHSWPWTVAHEAVLVTSGRAKYTDAELRRLYESDDMGPLGYLTVAKILSAIGSPAASSFATRGLTRLSAADFAKDSSLILDGDSVLSRSARLFAESLREVDDSAIIDLAELSPANAGEFLRTTARSARQSQDKPPRALLGEILDQAWDQWLKSQVRTALLQILRTPSAQNKGALN